MRNQYLVTFLWVLKKNFTFHTKIFLLTLASTSFVVLGFCLSFFPNENALNENFLINFSFFGFSFFVVSNSSTALTLLSFKVVSSVFSVVWFKSGSASFLSSVDAPSVGCSFDTWFSYKNAFFLLILTNFHAKFTYFVRFNSLLFVRVTICLWLDMIRILNFFEFSNTNTYFLFVRWWFCCYIDSFAFVISHFFSVSKI